LKGAIVFIVAFLIFLVITLGYPSLPPGKMIYDAIVGPVETEYKVLGIGASALVAAVFNGVVYGVIIWLVYTIAARMTKKEHSKEQTSQNQTQPSETKP
jgi:large-conductance mechanosensitive channel